MCAASHSTPAAATPRRRSGGITGSSWFRAVPPSLTVVREEMEGEVDALAGGLAAVRVG